MPPKKRKKPHLGQWWRERHLFESNTGYREQHMCSGEGEERRRQRKQRAEKCGFYLTAFLVVPCHAKATICMCVRGRETINRRWQR